MRIGIINKISGREFAGGSLITLLIDEVIIFLKLSPKTKQNWNFSSNKITESLMKKYYGNIWKFLFPSTTHHSFLSTHIFFLVFTLFFWINDSCVSIEKRIILEILFLIWQIKCVKCKSSFWSLTSELDIRKHKNPSKYLCTYSSRNRQMSLDDLFLIQVFIQYPKLVQY